MTATLLDYLALTDPAPKGLAEEPAQLVLRRADGTAETREIPPAAARAVQILLDRLAAGGRVALLEEDRELSPNEAAEILGMSRPLVVRRMENGDLPFHYVGTHRRCRLSDVLAFKVKADAQQRAVEALARHGEELERDYGL